MQLRELPTGGQLKTSGGVVNVPANVNSTITCLPRSLNESYSVPIKLKTLDFCYVSQHLRLQLSLNNHLPQHTFSYEPQLSAD